MLSLAWLVAWPLWPHLRCPLGGVSVSSCCQRLETVLGFIPVVTGAAWALDEGDEEGARGAFTEHPCPGSDGRLTWCDLSGGFVCVCGAGGGVFVGASWALITVHRAESCVPFLQSMPFDRPTKEWICVVVSVSDYLRRFCLEPPGAADGGRCALHVSNMVAALSKFQRSVGQPLMTWSVEVRHLCLVNW